MFLTIFVSAQKLQTISFEKKTDIDKILENVSLRDELKSFLIFNIGNKYLLISSNNQSYNYYIFRESFDYNKQTKIYNLLEEEKNQRENILDDFFKKPCKKCNNNHEDSNSYIYFLMNKDGKKVCEFFVPYIKYHNIKKVKYPIKAKYMKFLTEKLIYF